MDVALEGSLFNDRFTFSIGYYNKRNADLLYNVNLPISAGNVLTNGAMIQVLKNVGTMENQGWELQFGVDIIRNRNFKWNFNIDASFLKNKVVKLPDGKDIVGQALFQGKSRYEHYLYTWAGVDRATGNSLYKMEPNSPDYWEYDANGKHVYNESAYLSKLKAAKASGHYFEIDGEGYTDQTQYAGRQVQGTSLPTVYGSFGTNLSWKGLNFSMLFTYSLGGKTYNGIYASLMGVSSQGAPSALHKDNLKSWTEPNGVQNADGTWQHIIDPNGVPVNDTELSQYNNSGSSRFLFSSNYLTLKNINLNYDFPKKWVNALKLQNINVGVSIDNLFIATTKKGMNPQYSFGGGQGNYFMPARVFNFSLAFKF